MFARRARPWSVRPSIWSFTAVLTMQDVLLRLTQFWASHGCIVTQPMNTEVGAGTLNPATFLRVLGPEPWRVAYVEPSVRPDDSRYGDNPNRIQTHTQFQVILKPEPGDPQQLYVDSLRALGVDVNRHDVRFVEDNWASPALGAWGLGWEVWLDGLEITQFTYFQQAGGFSLDPVSVELTYGIERIVMALQGVSHFKDIAYAPGVSYGEAFGQAEYEMSTYYLDEADIDDMRAMFDVYVREAGRLIEKRLPVPAHVYVLKCSHAFNVLDSRGAIGATERARAFARMRALAHDVAALWIERRAQLGHPLGVAAAPGAQVAPRAADPDVASACLTFEIGLEELPAAEVTRTVAAVRSSLTDELAATRLRHGPIAVTGTPRRVVAVVEDVQAREDGHEQTDRGPRASAAFDADGQPTAAALGFARRHGVDVSELQRIVVAGSEHVGVVRQVSGRSAPEVLADVLPAVVTGLRADRNMRWSAPDLAFSRPIRWLSALYGDQVVPFAVSTLAAGQTTRVHRTAERPDVVVDAAERYVATLARHGIVVDGAARRRTIEDAAVRLAASVDGVVDLEGEAALLDEVTNLVEEPVAILGGFDERYLALPEAVLATVMKKHQRYLPVRSRNGGLLPHFVAVANGDCDQDLVRAGNEAVLRARYEDAAFFWRNDLAVAPEQMKERLGKLIFEERLGSIADRARRIDAIAMRLAECVRLSEDERVTLARAAKLAKFDLASGMVVELSSLAGVMAREYTLRAGETPQVADALFEMEQPRFAGDALPASRPGALLALADRFDLIAGLFGIAANPTGSSDPFGLRRAALGVTSILCRHPELSDIGIPYALEVAASCQPFEVGPGTREEGFRFITRRFEQALLEAGHPVEHVRAVLPLAAAPARAERTARELDGLYRQDVFQELVTALQRVDRIVPADQPARYDPSLFEARSERRLHEAVVRAATELRATGSGSLAAFATIAASLVEPIDAFFTEVLVMADDPSVRANRLGLLATIRDLASEVLAWRELK
jgi:glycyl-tRNA synthetase